jgi:lipoprotein-anchoring transpeptidase ErfK/SrfK
MVGRLLGLAALCVASTWMGSAMAQTYLPPPSQPYPANVRGPAQNQAQTPDVDVDDDEAMPPGTVPQDGRTATIPSPGPILSPDDPRYARAVPQAAPPQGPILSPDDPRYANSVPQGTPPQGPILSPNDPRYGQPPGPPPVIYSDRAPPQGAPAYDGNPRPPQAIGGAQASADPRAPVEQAPGVAGDGRNSVMSILPPEDQPETGKFELAPNLRRQEVSFVTKEPAGTIVVDTPNTYLYYVLGNNRAVRYGVRVGREGFTWAGVQKITRKAEWPDWHPPPEMIERQPYLPRFMAGGDGNPLGARAMYLGATTYRIHGTNQPSTIGKFVSSGCVGMLNDDVSDLYERVKVGTRVVVLPQTQPVTASAAPGAAAPYSPAPQGGPLPPQAGTSASATPMYRGDGRNDATAVQPLPPPTTIR